jgi:hypothetical protein
MIALAFGAGLLLGVAAALLVYFPYIRRARRQLERLRDTSAHVTRRALELEPRAFELEWLLWWLRNAVECSEADQTRASMVRYALAAALEPGLDFAEHAERLHRLAADPATPSEDRDAARCFVAEWRHYVDTRELPWTSWERTGKPRWNKHAQKRWYFAALDSWGALLPPAPVQAAEIGGDRH